LNKLEVPEFFHLGNDYTLGSAIAHNGEQIVNWKLVSFAKENYNPAVITGANSLYNKGKSGVGETEFDYYLQDKNVLFQLTYLPKELNLYFQRQKLRNFINHIINFIKCGNSCQSILQGKLQKLIPEKNYPLKYDQRKYQIINYISYPDYLKIVQENNIYFLASSARSPTLYFR
jgi:hypothetical protein